MEKHRELRDKITKLMEDAQSWLILSHEKPDGDTLGCGIALERLGRRLSKFVRLLCPDPCPPKYEFLAEGVKYYATKRLPKDFSDRDGIIICVDTSTAARSFPEMLDRKFSCPIINIDHHIDNELYGDINWIDPTASATGEMLTLLMEESSWGIKQDEAEALYIAVISDNGGFSFASTTLKSHRCAMILLEAGVSPNQVAVALSANLTERILNLWGRAMMRATVFCDGECAVYWLTKDDFAETGTSRDATENLVNFLLRIKGVRLAALCTELPDAGEPRARASIRASSPFNARSVANAFGGGGHDLASGCTISAPINDAVFTLMKEMSRHVSGISAGR